MPEWADIMVKVVLGIAAFLGTTMIRRAFDQLDSARREHDRLAGKFQEFQVHVPETYISRDTMRELVTSRLDRLETKIDVLLRNGHHEEA